MISGWLAESCRSDIAALILTTHLWVDRIAAGNAWLSCMPCYWDSEQLQASTGAGRAGGPQAVMTFPHAWHGLTRVSAVSHYRSKEARLQRVEHAVHDQVVHLHDRPLLLEKDTLHQAQR